MWDKISRIWKRKEARTFHFGVDGLETTGRSYTGSAIEGQTKDWDKYIFDSEPSKELLENLNNIDNLKRFIANDDE